MQLLFIILIILLAPSVCFRVPRIPVLRKLKGLTHRKTLQLHHSIPEFEVISPFDPSQSQLEDFESKAPLPLTEENVEAVLSEVRPFLQGDG